MEQVLKALNELLFDGGGPQVVGLREESLRVGVSRMSAMLVNGESCEIELQWFAKEDKSKWTPSSWLRAVGDRESAARRLIIQFVDFICTSNQRGHHVYRMFSRFHSQAVVPDLQVHLLELPKLRFDADYDSIYVDMHPLLELLKVGSNQELLDTNVYQALR